MTDYLSSNVERRIYFTARFVRWGVRTGWQGAPTTTALFDDVRDHDDNLVVNQIWFTVGRQIQSLHLQPGDLVSFMARVMRYRKTHWQLEKTNVRCTTESVSDNERNGHEVSDSQGNTWNKVAESDYCLKWPTRMHKTTRDRELRLFARV